MSFKNCAPTFAKKLKLSFLFFAMASMTVASFGAEDPGLPYEFNAVTHNSGDYIRILSSASDGAGNRYVAGTISSYPRVGDNPRESGFVELTTGRLTLPDRTEDNFVAKLNPEGQFEWMRLVPNAVFVLSTKQAIHIDPEGNIVFVGKLGSRFGRQTVEIDGFELTAGVSDEMIYAAKFSPTGQCLELSELATSNVYRPYIFFFGGVSLEDSAMDSEGNLFIVGQWNDNADFGGLDLGSVPDVKDWVGYVAKFAPNRSGSWVTYIDGRGTEIVERITLVEENDELRPTSIFISGEMEPGSEFGPDSGIIPVPVSGGNQFVARLHDYGNWVDEGWVTVFGGARQTKIEDIAAAKIGEDIKVVVAGAYYEDQTLLGLNLVAGEAMHPDIFLGKFSDNLQGSPEWLRAFAGNLDDIPEDVAIEASGSVLLCGRFEGGLHISGTNLVTLKPEGGRGSEGFLSRFDPQGRALWARRVASAESSIDSLRFEDRKVEAGEARLVGSSAGRHFVGPNTLDGSGVFTASLSAPAGPNASPLLVDDYAGLPAGKTLNIDVLSNDSDPDGEPLELLTIAVHPLSGSAEIVDGVIRYQPDPSFAGDDRIEYVASDPQGEFEKATVYLKVHTVENVKGWKLERFGPAGESGQIMVEAGEAIRFLYVSPHGLHHYWQEGGEWHCETPGFVDNPANLLALRDGFGVLHLFYYDSYDSAVCHASNDGSGWVKDPQQFFPPPANNSWFNLEIPAQFAGVWSAALNSQGRVVVYMYDPDTSASNSRIFTLGSGGWTIEDLALTGAGNPSLMIPSAGGRFLAARRLGDAIEFGDTIGWSDGAASVVEDFVLGIHFSEPVYGMDGVTDSSGRRWLAYDFNRTLRVALKDGTAWETELAVDAEVDSPRIAIDQTGTIHLAYQDASSGVLGYASKPADGVWTSAQIGIRSGAEPNLVLDELGFPKILSSDPSNNSIYLATLSANRPPVAADDDQIGFTGLTAFVDVLTNDSDPDGDLLEIAIVQSPALGMVTPSDDGRIRVNPPAGFTGTISFRYSVSDGRGGIAEATATVSFGAGDPHDANGDGIDDLWGRIYSVTSAMAGFDWDGDGVGNSEESRWGTDPYDSTSRPGLMPSYTEGGSVFSSMNLLQGKRYQLQSSANLGAWDDLGEPETGGGGKFEWDLGAPSNSYFTRVKLLPEADTDGDLLGDWHEFMLGTDLFAADTDGDGLDDIEEIMADLDAKNYYSGGPLTLVKISGDGQIAPEGGRFLQPVKVRVTRSGEPAAGISIFFGVSEGGIKLATTAAETLDRSASLLSQLVLTTDKNGEAHVYVRAPDMPGESDIQVSSVEVTGLPPVGFKLRTGVREFDVAIQVRDDSFVFNSSEPGAVIHYTTDGTDPTTDSPSVNPGELVPPPDSFSGEFRFAAFANGRLSRVERYRHTDSGIVLLKSFDDVFWIAYKDYGVYSAGANELGQLGRTVNFPLTKIDDYFQLFLGTAQLDDPNAPFHFSSVIAVDIAIGGQAVAAALTEPRSSDFPRPAEGTFFGSENLVSVPSTDTIARENTGTKIDGVTEVAAGSDFRVALTSAGQVFSQGYNADNWRLGHTNTGHAAYPVSGLAGVASIRSSHDYTLAIKNDGSLVGWGNNVDGNLGDGTTVSKQQVVSVTGLIGIEEVLPSIIRLIPATEPETFQYDVVGRFALARDTEGRVWSWGSNLFGNLGTGDTVGRSTPQQVVGLPPVTALAASATSGFCLAIDTTGTVWAWGNNRSGQLGIGLEIQSAVPVPVPLPGRVLRVSAGSRHALALLEDGRLFTWGDNSEYQLGQGTADPAATPVEVPIRRNIDHFVAGDDYSVVAMSDSEVLLWGTMIWRREVPAGPFSQSYNGSLEFPVRHRVAPLPESVSGAQAFTRFPDGDDDDFNGITDSWERIYFERPDSPGFSEGAAFAAQDFDGDGDDNLTEFRNGTNPVDPTSSRYEEQTAVAATDGSLVVQQDGSANYSIPIELPPGVNGLTPKVALNYNSNGGNGFLGVGWSLSAYSVITRGPTSLTKDGFIDPVDFDENDRYYLNNSRLVATAGIYGSNGCEYRLEDDPTQQVISRGNELNGPASFTVCTKGGLIQTFLPIRLKATRARSNEPDRGHMVWALSRVEDRSGNWINFTYGLPLNGYRLESIRYGGAGQTHPVAVVAFSYAESSSYGSKRSDSSGRFFGGKLIEFNSWLEEITITNIEDAPRLFKKYALAYDSSSITARSRLVSVEESGSDGLPLPKMEFEYEAGFLFNFDPWIEDNSLAPPHPITGVNGEEIGARLVDLDNDNRVDYIRSQRGVGGELISVSGGGYPELPVPMVDSLGRDLGARLVDLNGDGCADILFAPDSSSGETPAAYLCATDAAGLPTHWELSDTFTPPSSLILFPGVSDPSARLVDLNGDGLVDFLFAKKGDDGSSVRYALLNNGTGWTDGLNGGYRPPLDFFDSVLAGGLDLGVRLIDLNGDGLPEIFKGVEIAGQLVRETWFNTGTGWERATDRYFEAPVDLTDPAVRLRDINRDGLIDILYHPSAEIVQTSTYVNSGNGWLRLRGTEAFNLPFALDGPFGGKRVRFADYNGDGYVDVLQSLDPNAPQEAERAKAYANTSRGAFAYATAFASQRHYRPPAEIGKPGVELVDLNGDGLEDFLDYSDTTNPKCWVNNVGRPDLLVGVKTQAAADLKIEYGRLNEIGDFVTSAPDPGDAAARIQHVRDGRSLVKRVIVNNAGTLAAKTYCYAGYKRGLSGVGSLGFSWMEEKDEQTGIRKKTYFTQDYPLVGQIAKVELIQPNGLTIKSVETEWALRDFDAGETSTYFAYPVWTREVSFELDGSQNYTSYTTFEHDDFGNVVRSEENRGNGFSKVMVNAYANDTQRWLVGRLLRAQVTSSAPGASPITKSSSFANNPVTGLLESEVIEPGTPHELLTTYTRDAFGNAIRTENSGAGVSPRYVEVNFSADGRYRIIEENTLGHRSVFARDNASGRIAAEVDVNGLTSSFDYDGIGRKRSFRRPDGVVESTTFRWSFFTPDLPAAAYRMMTYRGDGAPVIRYYDRLQRLLRSESVNGDGEKIHVDREYDSRGWLARESNPYFPGATPVWTAYTYDILGRRTRVDHPDGNFSTTVYQGLVTVERNPLGQERTIISDVAGRTTEVLSENSSYLRYEYDAIGNQISVDANGSVSTATFDLRDRRTSISTPDTGTTHSVYNVFGEEIWRSNAAGEVIELNYDGLGRLTRRIESEGESNWTYDTAPGAGIGRLTFETSPGGFSRSMVYDALGRTASLTEGHGLRSFVHGYKYDGIGRLAELSYPGGHRVAYHYGKHVMPKSVSDAATGSQYWEAGDHDNFNNVTTEQLGNGLTTNTDYDPVKATPELTETLSPTGTVLQHLEFRFNSIGNLTQQEDIVAGMLRHYSYDNLNRLNGVWLNNSMEHSYSYDVPGNLLTKDNLNYTYVTPGLNRLTGITASGVTHPFVHDAKGNVTKGMGGFTSEFSSFNKPVKIFEGNRTSSFAYGVDRALISQSETVNGAKVERDYVTGLFEEWREFASVEARFPTATHREHHIFVNGKLVATHVSTIKPGQPVNAATRWFHRDHLGSVRVVTGEGGAELERFDYDPFGGRTGVTMPANYHQFSRGFTGHAHIGGAALVHMGGRVYDSSAGRFLSADPFVKSSTNAQGFNRYSYVQNNPLSLTDPSGFISLNGAFDTFKRLLDPNLAGDWIRGAGTLVAGMYWYYSGDYYTARQIYADFEKAGAFADGIMGILHEHGPTLAIVTVVSILTYGALSEAATWYYAAAIAAVTTFVINYAQGESVEDSAEAALYAGITAAVFYGVGELSNIAEWGNGTLPKVLAHGVAGGLTAELKGEQFDEGFITAAATQATSHKIDKFSYFGRVAAAAAVGGAASAIAGGDVKTGAATGAFSRLFNDENSHSESDGRAKSSARNEKLRQVRGEYEKYKNSDERGFFSEIGWAIKGRWAIAEYYASGIINPLAEPFIPALTKGEYGTSGHVIDDFDRRTGLRDAD